MTTIGRGKQTHRLEISHKMDSNPYTFIYVPDKECKALKENEVNDLLLKWSMKGSLNVQYYSFNQPFQAHNKEAFVHAFFSDPVVYSTLTYNQLPIGKPASFIKIENVPCTVLSMEFFDRLLSAESNIVRCDGKSIVQCAEEDIGGFIIDDNLRNAILNEEFENYKLFSSSERKQFLWKLFSHLCLGGAWCQSEFSIQPYLDLAKKLYKELVSVEKIGDSNELVVRSTVLQIQLYDDANSPLVPYKPDNPQDFMYLVVDPFKRSIAVLIHCYGGAFCI